MENLVHIPYNGDPDECVLQRAEYFFTFELGTPTLRALSGKSTKSKKFLERGHGSKITTGGNATNYGIIFAQEDFNKVAKIPVRVG